MAEDQLRRCAEVFCCHSAEGNPEQPAECDSGGRSDGGLGCGEGHELPATSAEPSQLPPSEIDVPAESRRGEDREGDQEGRAFPADQKEGAPQRRG